MKETMLKIFLEMEEKTLSKAKPVAGGNGELCPSDKGIAQ